MKIEYEILWIDDMKSWIDSVRDDVIEYLEEKGFIAKITEITRNTTDFHGSIKSEIEASEKYDIILVDYNLASTTSQNGSFNKELEKGDSIIKKIRDDDIYTEIVFYSTNNESHLLQLISKENIEGIFVAERDNFSTKVNKVIEVTLKKVLDLNTMRGIVTGETSILDAEMDEIQTRIFKTLTKEKQRVWLDEIIEKSKEYLEESIIPKYIKHWSEENIEELVESFPANIKIKNIRKYCKNLESLKSFNVELKHYQKEIIEKRNLLAHTKENPEGTIEKKEYKFTEPEAFKIRKNIKKYSEIFQKLKLEII